MEQADQMIYIFSILIIINGLICHKFRILIPIVIPLPANDTLHVHTTIIKYLFLAGSMGTNG